MLELLPEICKQTNRLMITWPVLCNAGGVKGEKSHCNLAPPARYKARLFCSENTCGCRSPVSRQQCWCGEIHLSCLVANFSSHVFFTFEGIGSCDSASEEFSVLLCLRGPQFYTPGSQEEESSKVFFGNAEITNEMHLSAYSCRTLIQGAGKPAWCWLLELVPVRNNPLPGKEAGQKLM